MQLGITTATMPYPTRPASPTLTNPDMILPYGEYDSTPSPPRSGAWKARPEDMNISQSLTYGGSSLGSMPMTPITPIIYGNGTMLSDIGEVTEAESTPGIGVRRIQTRIAKGGDSPVRSSPTMGYQMKIKRSKVGNHRRTVSMESDSTVRSDGQVAEVFADFDDSVSVGESAFQGDDEESVVDESYGKEMLAEAKTIHMMGSRALEVGNKEEELSSAALSRRAEMILANAKIRLDSMEGNLSRARSSLYISPSSSMSSMHSSSPLSRSTPSPPTQQRITPQMGAPPARHRQLNHSSLGPHSPGHTRISSENSIPTSPVNIAHSARTFTAANSLDPTPKFKGLVRTNSYDSQNSGRQSRSSPLSRSSDPTAATPIPEAESDGDRISPLEADYFVRSSTAEPYSHHEIEHRGLTRSASSMQMRDLTDKMKDLKGKISSLRDKAREDNMKRRSGQGLRTPSPFTAAEQWYATSSDYEDDQLNPNASVVHNHWNEGPSEHANRKNDLNDADVQPPKDILEIEDSEATSVYQDFEDDQTPSEEYGNVLGTFGDADPLNQQGANEEPIEFEDHAPENLEAELDEEQLIEDEYGQEFRGREDLDDQAYDSDGGESLYHDTSQVSISHEDREDAFDYEHFFLHSAMGSMSRQRHRRRGSVDSFGSEDSAETARGPEVPSKSYKDDLKPASMGHRRQQSADTVSTMATFATAMEGYAGEDDDGQYQDYAVQDVTGTQQDGGSDTKPSLSTILEQSPVQQTRNRGWNSRPSSILRDGIIQHTAVHRPSISSFASVSSGTSRSFPLVNKPRTTTSAPSTRPSSPTPPTSNPNTLLGAVLASGIMSTNGASESERAMQQSPVSMLHRDDQILVERLVASMGKCVLGLQEARRGSMENRTWRRRLEAAWRVLEADDSVV